MKKSKNEPLNQSPEDEEDYTLTEREKIMYQMLWGKNWDEEYPPESKKSK